MVYVEFLLCQSCKKQKPLAEYYTTIREVCKSCRKKNNKKERERIRHEEKLANERRDQDIKMLLVIAESHENSIDKMEKTIKDVRGKARREKARRCEMKERLEDAEKKLASLSELEQAMKGFVLAKEFMRRRT